MKWVSIILLAAMATCGQPKKKPHRQVKQQHHHRHEGVPAPRDFILVDSNWITHYQALEKEFNYTVQQDEKIKTMGGKFRVPLSVRDHYQDMLRAKGGSSEKR